MVNVIPMTGADRIPNYEVSYSWTSGASYTYNASFGLPGYTIILPHKKLYAFKHQERFLAFGDATMWYTWLDPICRGNAGYPDHFFAGYPWHDLPKYHSGDSDVIESDIGYDGRTCLLYNQRGNAVFLDGHAQPVTFEDSLIGDEYIIYDEDDE